VDARKNVRLNPIRAEIASGGALNLAHAEPKRVQWTEIELAVKGPRLLKAGRYSFKFSAEPFRSEIAENFSEDARDVFLMHS
jgi:hypothetical protein